MQCVYNDAHQTRRERKLLKVEKLIKKIICFDSLSQISWLINVYHTQDSIRQIKDNGC